MTKGEKARTYRGSLDRGRWKGLEGKGLDRARAERTKERRGEREGRKQERKAEVSFEIQVERTEGKRVSLWKDLGNPGKARPGHLEVVVTLASVTRKGTREGEWEKRLLQEVEVRVNRGIQTRSRGVSEGQAKSTQAPQVREWKEQVVRVGTGYRVRIEEKAPRTRRFDVGYADRKTYTRKPGREVKVDPSNMGRTLYAKGEAARVLVMNAVCAREKRRPVSEYTGSGIRRKSRVGKRKLKPTKPQAKQ
jgi:hypothetical protein